MKGLGLPVATNERNNLMSIFNQLRHKDPADGSGTSRDKYFHGNKSSSPTDVDPFESIPIVDLDISGGRFTFPGF